MTRSDRYLDAVVALRLGRMVMGAWPRFHATVGLEDPVPPVRGRVSSQRGYDRIKEKRGGGHPVAPLVEVLAMAIDFEDKARSRHRTELADQWVLGILGHPDLLRGIHSSQGWIAELLAPRRGLDLVVEEQHALIGHDDPSRPAWNGRPDAFAGQLQRIKEIVELLFSVPARRRHTGTVAR